MWAPLLLGSLMVVGNMIIQIFVLLLMVRMLMHRMEEIQNRDSVLYQTRALSILVFVLFFGHVLQFATWAILFLHIGQFQDFETAFYHSAVNFTSLGYGDIVMEAPWRVLGGMEAANGVLMFGLSAGALLSMMNRIFLQNGPDLFSREGRRGP
jgi:hypothetical protein